MKLKIIKFVYISDLLQGIFIFKNDKSIKELRKKKPQLVNASNEQEDWYLMFQSTWKETEKRIGVSRRCASSFWIY